MFVKPLWRNWQTHLTQNQAGNHAGSSPATGTKIATANDTIRIIGGSCFLIKTQYNKIVRAYSQIIMKGKGASNEKMYIINVCACYFCVPCFGWV